MKDAGRIHELEKLIRYHQDLYYKAESEIEDSVFDALWDELRSLDPENALFKTVGADTQDGFPKAEHIIPMGSQEKAANPEEFRVWAGKIKFDDFLVQYKLDGASLELQYTSGRFERAVTRGDGKIGDEITANARRMRGVLSELAGVAGPGGASPFTGGIRGEVIMKREVLRTLYTDKANCRNAANGLMKRKDGIGSADLDFICYDAVTGTRGNPFAGAAPFQDENEKLLWLKACGFSTVPSQHCKGAESVIEYRARVIAERPSLPYDIDGLVVKGFALDPDDASRPRPEKQIAFKFSLEEAVSVLRAVEWSESGVTYTPIALIDPVQLAGTTVQRANLANPNMIKELGLMIGSRVVVTKRGEIIPKIEALVENPPDAQKIIQPQTCSSCSTALRDEGTRLFCPNPACLKLIHHRLEKWISVLDIREFGVTLLERLFAAGRLRSILDLYTLTEAELAALERMGELSAAKVRRSIHSKKEISLSKFIAGFDIDGIGETMVEKLTAAGFTSLEALFTADAADFAAVYQFGEILAQNLSDGLQACRPEMEQLLSSGYISIAAPKAGGPLSGSSFCFTGELQSMKRPQAEERVKALGGSAKSSVGKGLTYLVTNDPSAGSSKLQKARELGIAVIDEQRFLAMLEEAAGGTPVPAQMELPL